MIPSSACDCGCACAAVCLLFCVRGCLFAFLCARVCAGVRGRADGRASACLSVSLCMSVRARACVPMKYGNGLTPTDPNPAIACRRAEWLSTSSSSQSHASAAQRSMFPAVATAPPVPIPHGRRTPDPRGVTHAGLGRYQVLGHAAASPPHLRRDWAHPRHICAGTGVRFCRVGAGTGAAGSS